MSYGSNILGGFLGTLWYSAGYNDNSAATNVGVVTRITPLLDPHNIDVRGTGERGLYDILLGQRDPRVTIDFMPYDKTFLTTYQAGSVAMPYLHVKWNGITDGLTFVGAKMNRETVEVTAGEAVKATMELWAGGNSTYPAGIIRWNSANPTQTWGTRGTTPYRWLNTILSLAGAPVTDWWSWRYEVQNNLQRLINVSTGGTRDLKNKARDVTGLIVKDLADFEEYGTLANLGSEAAKFAIRIQLDGSDLLNTSYCRWGRIEAPFAAEDLIAKRFPFTATDLTALTP
jgi:hypothetical protein